MTALRASSALRCESMKSPCTLRPANWPWPFWYFAKARTPLTTPWNAPGRTGLSTSAITAIRIVSAVTPISLSGEPPGWLCAGAELAEAGITAQPIPTATATRAHRLRFTAPPSPRLPPPGTAPVHEEHIEITVLSKAQATLEDGTNNTGALADDRPIDIAGEGLLTGYRSPCLLRRCARGRSESPRAHRSATS